MRREATLIVLLLIACATGYIVEDSDARLQYKGIWFVSQSNTSSGGTQHRTNVPGAGVMLRNFTGCAAAVFGCSSCKGAQFTFAISDGGPAMLCTARGNTTIYRTELCSIVGLNKNVPRTLIITHNDTMGRWLSFDFLDIDAPHLPPVGKTITSASKISSLSSLSSTTLSMSSDPLTSLSGLTGFSTATSSSTVTHSASLIPVAPTRPSSMDSGVLVASVVGALFFIIFAGVAGYALYRWVQHRRRMRAYTLPPETGHFRFVCCGRVDHGLRSGDTFAWDSLPNPANGYTFTYTDPYSAFPAEAVCPPRLVLHTKGTSSYPPSPDPTKRREPSPELESATLLPSRVTFAQSPSSEYDGDTSDDEEYPLSSPIIHSAPRAFRPPPVIWVGAPTSGELSVDRQPRAPQSRVDGMDRTAPRGPRPRYL